MDFDRYPYRPETALARTPSPRRLAAARRHLQRKADEVALFPELAPTQTPLERCQSFDRQAAEFITRMRALEAKHWRQGRAMLRQLPEELVEEVAQNWLTNRFLPKSATYFADHIHTALRKAQQ
jgi:hypothetical protein